MFEEDTEGGQRHVIDVDGALSIEEEMAKRLKRKDKLTAKFAAMTVEYNLNETRLSDLKRARRALSDIGRSDLVII